MEKKGLHLSMEKTYFLWSGTNLDLLKETGKDHCAICLTGVCRNVFAWFDALHPSQQLWSCWDTTLFSLVSLTKWLTSTLCIYFRL